MNIDEIMVDVICDVESIIGSGTYNPRYNDDEGYDYRYPVHFFSTQKAKEEGNYSKEKETIRTIFEPDQVKSMEYRFGSNYLNIGKSILDVLDFLEERYGIDFNHLEQEYRKTKGKEFQDKLECGEDVRLVGGRYFGGLDIPVGDYVVYGDRGEKSGILCPFAISYDQKGSSTLWSQIGEKVTVREGEIIMLPSPVGSIILRKAT